MPKICKCGKEIKSMNAIQSRCYDCEKKRSRQRVTRSKVKKKVKEVSEATLMKQWAQKVKENAGYACEYCGKTSGLNSHHFYTRSKKSTRYDEQNGFCLCVAHHTFSSVFSAHKTPADFVEWAKEKRGIKWYEDLRERARTLANTTAE